MRDMTDAEIIKAYEDKVDLIASMTSVYLDGEDGFNLYEVMTNTLDLINRQKAEIERLNKKAEKVFEATINKVLSMKNLYVIVDNKFVEVEMMEELEYLFGMVFCEFNDDYEENLDNLLKELAGDDNG